MAPLQPSKLAMKHQSCVSFIINPLGPKMLPFTPYIIKHNTLQEDKSNWIKIWIHWMILYRQRMESRNLSQEGPPLPKFPPRPALSACQESQSQPQGCMNFNESPNLMDAYEVLVPSSHVSQSLAIPQGPTSHSMAQRVVRPSMLHVRPFLAPMPSVIQDTMNSSRPPMRSDFIPH